PRRLVPALEPVVAERALPDAPVLLLAQLEAEDLRWRVARLPGDVPLVEHAEGARRHAVAAAVADVLLNDDGVELGAEERAGRADIEAGGVGAVLADVRAHQPAQRIHLAVATQRLLLLDEGDVAPGVRAELGGVVVRLAGPDHAVLGDEVPLLTGDLAGLAADADRRVREEADALLRLRAVGAMRVHAAPRRISGAPRRADGGRA